MPWWSSQRPRPPPNTPEWTQSRQKNGALTRHSRGTNGGLERHLTHPLMLLSMLTAPSPSVPSSRRGMEASISLRPSALVAAGLTWRPLTPSQHLPAHNFRGISCHGLPSAGIRGVRAPIAPLAVHRVLATAPRSMLASATLTATKYTTFAALSSSKWRG